MFTFPVSMLAAAPVTGGGSAAGVAYTASQDSNYNNNAIGTYANLTDSDGTTGAGTFNGTGFIKATFPYPVLVAHVKVGGGNLTNYGQVAASVNGSLLQYSTDNATWTTALTISGVTDSGANQFVTFNISPTITAQYWRLYKSSADPGTSEFVFT